MVSILYFGLTGILVGWWTSGLDVNSTAGDRCPLLYLAIQGCDGGNLGVARKLLELGHNVNAEGGNALQAAAQRSGSEDAVRFLLDRGANVNAQGGEHGNALQAAAQRCDSEATARFLLDRGADVNAKSGKYSNALQAVATMIPPSAFSWAVAPMSMPRAGYMAMRSRLSSYLATAEPQSASS